MTLYIEVFILMALVLVNRLGFVYVIDRKLHLSFVRNPVLTFVYFMAMTLFVSLVFFPYAVVAFDPGWSLTVIFFLFVLFVLNPWAYRHMQESGLVARRLAKLYPNQPFLQIDERYLLSKTGDVIFQQTALAILALMLTALGMPFTTLVPVFAVAFALLHFHLFFSMPLIWAVYFTICASVSGFVLPYLLLLVPGGVYYAIILHLLWYVGSGALFGSIEKAELRALKQG
jgi:hypothetical protein